MKYKVKLDIFEGPFDLLVYLIERAEMNIYDIRVSEITNQYIEYIKTMQKLDVVFGAEFMVLAATLIEIKSKMLIPRVKVEEALASEEDPRNQLVQKLLEYKKYKQAASEMEIIEEENLHIFTKPQEDLIPYTKEPDEILALDLDQFVKAFSAFLIKKQKLEEIHKTYERIERQRMTVESRIEQIRTLFRKKKKYSFTELLEGETSRYNLVLTFMSLLELMRDRAVWVKQTASFGEIIISLNEQEPAAEEENSA